MLTTLLPGLRELRAPIAAGYLWLLTGWFAFHDRFPPVDEGSGVIRALQDLGSVAHAFGLAIALTFTGYLLGSVSLGLFEGVGEAARHWIIARGGTRVQGPPYNWDLPTRLLPAVSIKREVALELSLNERIRQIESQLRRGGKTLPEHPKYQQLRELAGVFPGHSDDHPLADPQIHGIEHNVTNNTGAFSPRIKVPRDKTVIGVMRDQLAVWLTEEILNELRLVGTRLIGKEPELFSHYDRLRAESEFRRGITPPMTALIVQLALTTTAWAVMGLGGIGLLMWEAWKLNREANELLVDAIVVGTVDAPAFETFSGVARELLEEGRSTP